MGDGHGGIDKVASSWTLCGWLLLRGPFVGGALCGLAQSLPLGGALCGCTIAQPIGTTAQKSPCLQIAFESSNPFPLHSCKLHALLSAAHILFACLLELC